jgi:hypothetical protein
MAARKGTLGTTFWALWSIGVLLLALAVWLGLRFWSAYADCSAYELCGTRAFQAALFMETSDIDRLTLAKTAFKPVPISTNADGEEPEERAHRVAARVDPDLVKRIAALERDVACRASDAKKSVTLTLGHIEVHGALSRQVVMQVLQRQRHLAAVRTCLQKECASAVPRRVVLQLTVAASGRIIVARVKHATRRNCSLEKCMIGSAMRWLYPKPRTSIATVSIPFVFTRAR